MVRSDARENRDRILEVARRAFEESGDTSLNQIARRANVGPGTLYRHFPTREALVLAVYRRDIELLVGSVPELLATKTPLDALRSWITELVRSMRVKHGLGDALSPGARQSVTEQSYGPVIAAITQMLEAGQRDGSIRDDTDAADVLLLTGALWRAPEGEAERSQRMLSFILDGLRTQR
ncbi:TetR/AcrR family transcriptional regulator [Conexibacter sp. CPCC 206217]|uniref:TetR/AcrR family transcriptional regulator n=1 Tax=Conexibacter sp. CPCC 206217 TaxID=3064574 RepID=UPI002727AE71|nr:TetR/AcrR family transcriptional regulator [Conexibacter sp. CPCC 206217]MDO8209729.1 TetR/AcrR family transcriptional regulator [Conexibacter sp. CPCC 206217]